MKVEIQKLKHLNKKFKFTFARKVELIPKRLTQQQNNFFYLNECVNWMLVYVFTHFIDAHEIENVAYNCE